MNRFRFPGTFKEVPPATTIIILFDQNKVKKIRQD